MISIAASTNRKAPSRVRRTSIIATTVAVLGAAMLPVPVADAQTFDSLFSSNAQNDSARKRRERRAEVRRTRETKAPAKPREAAAPKIAALPKVPVVAAPPEPLVAVISLPSQRIQVHNGAGMVTESRVSTGQSGHRTPTGVFSILQRNRYHESNIYSGAPMPFMQRVTWSGIALHQGVVPGYPASHGCIRLPGDFASRMWGLGRVGMRVIITPSDVQPAAIEHARLPVPVMSTVTADVAPDSVQTAAIAGSSPVAEQRQLDPFRYAQTRKIKAALDAFAAEKAVKPALDLAQEKSTEASKASEDLRRLERALAMSEQNLAARKAAAEREPAATPDSETGKALSAATATREQAEKDLASARADERQKSDAAFDAAKAVRATELAAQQAQEAGKLANVSMEPVSVFISRKEGRVFVRQGFMPLHDEPIIFTEPERPLGTHVYTAMSAKDGGSVLSWAVVTVPNTPPEDKPKKEAEKPRKKGEKAAAAEPPKPALPASNAAGALDRFELPEATKKLISDKLWPGASLTVSDYGISGETGKGTDFVVLTK